MKSSPLFSWSMRLAAWLSGSLLALILGFLLWKSLPFFQQQGAFALLTAGGWFPAEGQYQLLPMLVGSLLCAVLAVVIAAPVGVMLAVFSRYYAPAIWASLYRGLMELLSGIPSVVYGFWGLIVLVPLINYWVPPGASLLAGSLVLALMILPLMVLSADAAFSQLSPRWEQAAQALSVSRWGLLRKVLLPQALPGILSGGTLQFGRALGETMAVLMVCGNIVQIPGSVFEPVRTLTANIALEMAYATGTHTQALFVSGLLLLLMTVMLFVGSAWLRQRTEGLQE